MQKVKVIAHRGAGGWDSGYAPENTMPAFRKAIEMGADGIELDVQLTRDDVLVICHDETIDRTSDGHGYIKNMTLAELRKYNFCSSHTEYGFTPIPTLEEFLAFMAQESFALNIELKTGVVYYDSIEKKTFDMVHAFGLDDRVLYSSFNYYSLEKLRTVSADARIGILCSSMECVYVPEDAARIGAEAIHPDFHGLTAENMQKCHTEGHLRVNAWTADREDHLRALIDMGVDAIITDCPDRARKVVDAYSHS